MKKNYLNPLTQMTHNELFLIADHILFLRQNILHMTQAQFSSALNISQTYLSQIERKQKFVTPTVAHQICIIFKVRKDWLLSGSLITSENIFQSKEEAVEHSLKLKQEDSLYQLSSTFNLNDSNIDFLNWYLHLSDGERSEFQHALKLIQTIK